MQDGILQLGVNMGKLFEYFLIGFIIIAITFALYLPIFFILKKRITAIRQFCVLLLIGCTCIILFATVLWGLPYGISFYPAQHYVNIIPFQWARETWAMGKSKMTIQLISNILMFVPVGLFVPIVFAKARSFWKTMCMAFVFTFSIETFQYLTGRSADIDDLILNLLGAMIGYGVFALFSRCFQHKSWWLKALGSIK